jgi:hypothetical protein
VSPRRPNKITLAIIAGMVIGGLLHAFDRFDRPVRCREGHLFTTIWIPLASVKALRFGRRRFQRCPVGHHWSLVTPLDRTSAGAAELETARAVHDVRIP